MLTPRKQAMDFGSDEPQHHGLVAINALVRVIEHGLEELENADRVRDDL